MARHRLSAATVIFSLIVHAISDDFINPPAGPCGSDWDLSTNTVYNVGDIIELQWTTSLDKFTLALWQGLEGQADINYQIATPYSGNSLQWVVDPHGYEISANPVFSLAIFQIGATAWEFESACFNMTNNGNALATLHSVSVTPSSSSAPTSTSTKSTKTTAPAKSNSQAGAAGPTAPTVTVVQNKSDNSTAIGAGVGVGVGVGVLIIGLAIGYFVFRRREKKRKENTIPSWQYPPTAQYGYYGPQQSQMPPAAGSERPGGDFPPRELPTSPTK